MLTFFKSLWYMFLIRRTERQIERIDDENSKLKRDNNELQYQIEERRDS